MAHGHNGTPPAPEWFHDPALERCIGCNQTRDGCEAVHRGPKCCGWCSHRHVSPAVKMPPSEAITRPEWNDADGDQA